MKIYNIPCTLKNQLAVRLVKKFMAEIAKNHPKDFQKILSKTTLIKRVPKREIDTGTRGQVIKLGTDSSKRKDWGKKLVSDKDRNEGVFEKVIVCIDETIKDSESMFVTIAHEFGHVCTTELDLSRRNAPSDEWASEASADWYIYKWGYGKSFRKVYKKNPRDLLHHGVMPGQIVTENGATYRLSRNFVYRNISGPFKSYAASIKDRCLEYESKTGISFSHLKASLNKVQR